MLNERKDHLTAQKVEVALVFQEMLSTAEAQTYLARNGVVDTVIERVLFQPSQRRNYAAGQRGAFLHQAA